MFKVARDFFGLMISICAIWIFAKFYMRLDQADKEGREFNPIIESVKLVKEAAHDLEEGWNDTTYLEKKKPK